MKHITDPSVRCKADAVGADTYAAYDKHGAPVTVLTFSQKSADWLALNHEPDSADTENHSPLLLAD